MSDILEEVKFSFPGRSVQIDQLNNLYGYKDEPFPDCVYLTGGPSTGKTSIISTLLQKLDVKYASINLFECYTSKILFETLLNQLSGHSINPSTGQPFARCDNMMDFLYYLHKCSENVALDRWVIVLDKAEQLRNMDYNLLTGFLRFPEISGFRISVIMISEIVFQKFYTKLNVVEPLKIGFPQYNKDELLEILSRDFEEAYATVRESNSWKKGDVLDEDFYRNYLNVFLSVFYRACRDLSELRYMAKLNFVKYCEPIAKKEKSMNDSIALWRHIAPVLKASLEVLYLRVSSVNEGNKYDANRAECSSQIQKQFSFSKENLAQSLELPFYAKYLLIAAYLASYNPAKEDKRLFMKYHGKKHKTMKDVKKKSKVSELLNTQLGPKSFSFDRLLAIFYAILDDKMGFNNNLLVQVSSLVELQLLTALSDNYNLDGQKYKCSVGFEFIQIISKMVGFNIRKYLVDFSHF